MSLIFGHKSYNVFAFIILMLLSISLFSQDDTNVWKLYKKIDGIEINYRYQECNNPSQGTFKEYVLFQYKNTNDYPVEINYYIEFFYNNNKNLTNNNNSEENHRRISVKPKQIIETSCNKNREYNIFSKFLNYNKAELTKFELIDIEIEQ